MTKQGETNVPMASASNNRSITATFSITFDNKFLPIPPIYKSNTYKSLPKVDFPDGFSLSANETHYSNKKYIKFINEIIMPYIQKEGKKVGCKIFFFFWGGGKQPTKL